MNRDFVTELLRTTGARRISSAATILLSIAFVVVIAITVSRSDQERTALSEELDAGVSRVLEVRSSGVEGFLPSTLVDAIASLSDVQYVAAIGPAEDTFVTGTGRGPVGLRRVIETNLEWGIPTCSPPLRRIVLDDELARNLGMSAARGALETSGGAQFAISHLASVPDEIAPFVRGAVTSCPSSGDELNERMTTVLIVVNSADRVDRTTRELRAITSALSPDVTVSSAAELAEFRNRISSQVNNQRRLTATGAIVTLPVVYLIVGAALAVGRRQEFGRRRALGASRLMLAVLVLGESSLLTLVAGLITSFSAVTLQAVISPWADLEWLSSALLVVYVSAAIGQVPVLLSAALMDPVKVLRIP